ncbi:MAG: MFS transporter [Spirochaetes bacterium]|nr:MFS transporter [Spirochaetota bacterium]
MNLDRIAGTFRALKNRNYRLFFTGQGISLIGTWMQQVAMSWLVYRISGSAFMLGIVGFCNMIPSLLLFPLTGVSADRFNKRSILILTQSLSMIQAFILAMLVFSGLVAVWHIIILSTFFGIVNSFDMAARQSFVVELIDKREDLPNAIALNSTLFNSARLIGPTIAGILISIVGEGFCFLLNSLSYVAVIYALIQIILKSGQKKSGRQNALYDIVEGVKYTFGFAPIRIIIFNLAIVSFTGTSFMVLMPVFAKNILHGDAHTLGLLTGAVGLGALAGSLHLASRKKIIGLGRNMAVNGILFGISLFFFAGSDILALSLCMLVIMGYSMITIMASSNTIIQTIVKDSMRGRVMSFYILAFAGVAPLGSLTTGSLAHLAGPVIVVAGGGILTLLGAIFFLSRLSRISKYFRPIYIGKDIIPEMAQGIQNADSITSLQKE